MHFLMYCMIKYYVICSASWAIQFIKDVIHTVYPIYQMGTILQKLRLLRKWAFNVVVLYD